MAKPKDLRALVELAATTQTLLTHFQSSLAPAAASPPPPATTAAAELPNPLDAVKAATTLLRSHATTLSLLLITPPFTPSAIVAKLGDVSSGALTGIVAAASYVPHAGQKDELGTIMRAELKTHVRRLLVTWGQVLALVVRMAEARQANGAAKANHVGPTESEKQAVLSATAVVWGACDALLALCADGVVGVVVRKAAELRAVLLDAIDELKEWGDDVQDGSDGAEGSDDEDSDVLGAENKLGADDTELKELLDTSVKKLKMVGMLYQALAKRRLKTYSAAVASTAAPPASANAASSPAQKLDQLMALLKTIPETADDLASTFYQLDEDGARQTLEKCCGQAKTAVELVKQSWTGADDEFTAWSGKWVSALDAA